VALAVFARAQVVCADFRVRAPRKRRSGWSLKWSRSRGRTAC